MRKLNKTDRARSEALVGEGGKACKRCTMQLNCYELTLEHPPDEFFAGGGSNSPPPSLDGTKPILRLLKRRE